MGFRALLVGMLAGLGLAFAQGLVKGLTPGELEGLLREMGLGYEKRGEGLFLLKLEKALKVWVELDWCEEGRCGLVALYAGFRKDGVSLEQINRWNRERRFSRAYLDEDGDLWVEWELDLTEGVSRETVKEFFRLFTETTIPTFMEHIGFSP
ncbi:YbjN domain-containing protein [Thermus altitudinis]|uniref:YbjN domain-containing protein n=1 Tax=Thermus altitudinis TaxID=2908145 RepID=UPI001FAA593E|nr:YbjN domain-containing protein [Thermus altitudinis]